MTEVRWQFGWLVRLHDEGEEVFFENPPSSYYSKRRIIFAEVEE